MLLGQSRPVCRRWRSCIDWARTGTEKSGGPAGGSDVQSDELEQMHTRSAMEGEGCVDEPGPETRGAHQGQWVSDGGHGLTEPGPETKRAAVCRQQWRVATSTLEYCFMYDSHLLCVIDTSCHFQRAGLDLLTTHPQVHHTTALVFYSQTGKMTDSV